MGQHLPQTTEKFAYEWRIILQGGIHARLLVGKVSLFGEKRVTAPLPDKGKEGEVSKLGEGRNKVLECVIHSQNVFILDYQWIQFGQLRTLCSQRTHASRSLWTSMLVFAAKITFFWKRGMKGISTFLKRRRLHVFSLCAPNLFSFLPLKMF